MCVNFGEWQFLSGVVAGVFGLLIALWYVAREEA